MLRDHFKREAVWMAVFLLTPLLLGVVAAFVAPALHPHRLSPDRAFAAADDLFHATAGCGSVVPDARDAGDHWEFTAHVGYAGQRDPNPILVDKRTGRASWATKDRINGDRDLVYPEF